MDDAEPSMDDAEKFRRYAAECKRLAEKATAKDKPILLELADAWIVCAEEAERRTSKTKKNS